MRIRLLNLLFIFSVLVAPLAVFLPIVPKVTLNNVETLRKPKVKRLSDFTLGTFQRVADVWAYQQSRVWSLFVKAENTLNYHIFNLASEKYSNETLMGKAGTLFDRIYVNDLNGTYSSATPDPDDFARLIKNFQDLIESHGKQFLLIVHPSKTVMNPDWLTDSLKVGQPNPRMIEILEPAIRSAGINMIKVGDRFTDKSLRYWPKSGAHLNSLGKCLSAQSLLQALTSKKPGSLPEITCQYSASKLSSPEGEDLDLLRLVNAWKTRHSLEEVPDVELQVSSRPREKHKPSALFVGTSYTFGLMGMLRSAGAFSNTDFLFYDKTQYFSKNIGQTNEVRGRNNFKKNLHSTEFILSHDIVVLESTEARLHQLGFGIMQAVEAERKKSSKE